LARQTRSQRRAQRRQQAEPTDGGLTQRARARQAQVRPSQQPIKSQTGAARSVPGSGGKRFISESIAELKKVEWPNQNQVIQGVVVVLIACVIVGFYLWVADQAFRRLVQDVFLR
jgi:preprotein translocase subunit SecE